MARVSLQKPVVTSSRTFGPQRTMDSTLRCVPCSHRASACACAYPCVHPCMWTSARALVHLSVRTVHVRCRSSVRTCKLSACVPFLGHPPHQVLLPLQILPPPASSNIRRASEFFHPLTTVSRQPTHTFRHRCQPLPLLLIPPSLTQIPGSNFPGRSLGIPQLPRTTSLLIWVEGHHAADQIANGGHNYYREALCALLVALLTDGGRETICFPGRDATAGDTATQCVPRRGHTSHPSPRRSFGEMENSQIPHHGCSTEFRCRV